jgi:hypothetical protein
MPKNIGESDTLKLDRKGAAKHELRETFTS